MSYQIPETGEWIETPQVVIHVALPTIKNSDGSDIEVGEAISLLMAQRDYWKARARRFETELADERAGQGSPGGADETHSP